MQDHEHLPQSYEALDEALARIKYLVLRTLTHEGRHHLYQLARASGELVDALSHEHGAAQARFATGQLEALMAEPARHSCAVTCPFAARANPPAGPGPSGSRARILPWRPRRPGGTSC